MNRLISSLALLSMLLQSCSGASAQSNNPDPVPGPKPGTVVIGNPGNNTQTSSADTTPDTAEQKTFKLEQETTLFDLEHKEVEPVYETQQVPDTCTRQVQHGTREECHTEYDRRCTTRNENECRNVPYPVCQSVPRQVCQNVPRRECRNVPREVCETTNDRVCRNEPQRVCTNVPRRQCSTVQQCSTVNDQVCRGAPPNQVCQNVPRRECKPVEQCSTVNDSVCHSEDRQVCSDVPRRQCHTQNGQQCSTVNDSVCHTENQEECHDENRQECQTVPRQSCTNVPRQVCGQVPNMEDEQYSCMRDVRVQVGERVKVRVASSVKIIVTNFGKVPLNSDEFKAKLTQNEVVLSIGNQSKLVIYRLVKKERSEQILSANERQIQSVFYIEMISVGQLSEIGALKVIDPKITFDKLQFKIASPSGSDLENLISINSGKLSVVRVKRRRLLTIIDSSFDPAIVLKKTADGFEISFSAFNVRSLDSFSHQVHLELGVKNLLNRNELLNPELLDRLSLKPMVSEFESFPVN
jgi:hypothetical protein